MKFKKADLVKLYRNLVLAQAYDKMCIRMALQGKLLSFYHPAEGGEAPGVAGTTFLKPSDIIYMHHRGHGIPHMLGKGADVKTYIAEHCGKATGCANGLGGVHPNYPELGIKGAGGTIGSGFSLTLGWGLAAKKKAEGQVVVCFCGDGAMARGTWHESANVAALWGLPIVYVCENNGIAQYVRFEDACPFENFSRLAAAFGIPYKEVDGQDAIEIAGAVKLAVDKARKGKGPSFVECKTARFGPHGMGNPDHIGGKPRPEKDKKKERDSIEILRKRLLADKVLTKGDVEKIAAEVEEELKATETFIDESPIQDDPTILEPAVYAP